MSARCGPRRRARQQPRKQNSDAIRHKVAREVAHLLRVIFRRRCRSGHLYLVLRDMMVRSAMRQTWATALSELMPFPAPTTERLAVPCACGYCPHDREPRFQPVLTAVGKVVASRRCKSWRLPWRPSRSSSRWWQALPRRWRSPPEWTRCSAARSEAEEGSAERPIPEV